MNIEDRMIKAGIVKQLLTEKIYNEAPDDFFKYNTLIWGAYSNDREQGYSLTISGRGDTYQLFFSENRNSDQIVVYTQKNMMDRLFEDGYATAKYFSEYEEAAEYILEKIKTITAVEVA